MKPSEKKKPIKTLPDGIWESSSSEPRTDKNKNNPAIDLQGNGYPTQPSDNQNK